VSASRAGSQAMRRGEVVLRDATRSFSVRADPARTLKGLLLGKRAPGPAPVPALRGVTLRIEPGQTVGMVGRNGAGKTSTLRVLAGIVPLQSGEVACGGRVLALLELAAGFSRDFSGRENVFLQGALYGLSKREVNDRLEQIIDFAELGEFIDIPVKTYSSGMFVRLGFAIAAHLDADVLLIDEVLAVGDESFQRKCMRRIAEQIAAGATVVLVSHDPGAIERVCERVVVLDAGRVVFDGPTAEGLLHYHQLMGTVQGGGRSYRHVHRGAAGVTDVELRDAAGRASSVFRSGEELRLAVEVRAPVRDRAELTLELRAGEGVTLFRTSTPFEPGPDGRAELLFEVPELWLLGGDYDLLLGVAPGGEEPVFDRTVRFSVPSGPGAQGLLDLRGSWRSLTAARSGAQ